MPKKEYQLRPTPLSAQIFVFWICHKGEIMPLKSFNDAFRAELLDDDVALIYMGCASCPLFILILYHISPTHGKNFPCVNLNS